VSINYDMSGDKGTVTVTSTPESPSDKIGWKLSFAVDDEYPESATRYLECSGGLAPASYELPQSSTMKGTRVRKVEMYILS
jgi:hypothetical protein